MSVILAIETSTEIASVALLANEQILAREISGTQTHSQTILPLVSEILAESGMSISQCDAFAFGSGPGSFTGVRTACGIVQGLAFGVDRPVIPVVTLEAMAFGYKEATGVADILTVLDARMGEVYWAQYHYADAVDVLIPPTLSIPERIVPLKRVDGCGNGLTAYREKIPVDLLNIQGDHSGLMPHAGQIVKLAKCRLSIGQVVHAHEAQPFYLRNKVAMTTAERAARANA